MAEIPVLQNILRANDELAGQVRRRLAQFGVVALNCIGAPGTGKTALLERTIPLLKADVGAACGAPTGLRVAVIEADCATARDAQRIQALGVQVVQINTGKGCHVPAHLILQALDNLALDQTDLLLIENVGNLVCPSELDIGESAKVAVASATEGDDKPQKYPMLFRECAAVVLNKIDLIPHTDFSRERFESDLRQINAHVPLFAVSCRTGEGIETWAAWVRSCVKSL
jgi:hydrogenase nickel incorporation protein HypB